MTKQLRAHFKSVLSLSIKKVCLRQYHFSMEGMRKGFLFCQRKVGLNSRCELQKIVANLLNKSRKLYMNGTVI